MGKWREKWLSISINLFLVFTFSALLYFNPPGLHHFLKRFQNIGYDVMVGFTRKPVAQGVPIAIVDVDDRSIGIEGRWPWNRKKLGQLVENLYKQGAKGVVLDFLFSEPEPNIIDQIAQEAKEIDITELQTLKETFHYDEIFAKALALGHSTLGFALTNEKSAIGMLPEPLFELPLDAQEALLIPAMPGYLADIPVLQRSAKSQGFINATPDFDGVIRYSPLLLRYENKVFPSLSLAAVRLFLGNPDLKILTAQYKNKEVIEAIFLGDRRIPTDAWGKILVPFRGPSFSLPYISATDVLTNKAAKEEIENKLIFIGSSATAMGDLVTTPTAPVFVGVEVHAQIALGILEGYLPYKPVWEKGVRLAIVFCIGLLLAFTLPFLGPIFSFIFTAGVTTFLVYGSYMLWREKQIVFPIVFPLFSIALLFLVNEAVGFLFEKRRRKELKAIFGQYVPPEYLNQMLKKGGEFGMEGKSRELTVLFADVRKFTTLSEGLSAQDLKALLNDFLTPMTEAIFEKKGTIDKYVGDMIMAFWGAPLDDLNHAEHAIEAAFGMHAKLALLNKELKANNRPEMHIGVGINTGSMNVGDMGSKYRKAYTVLGDAVNLGSRLESLTRVYNINTIVGAETYEKTKNQFIFRLIDKVKVKGKSKAIAIYEPICKVGEKFDEAKLAEHEKGLEAYMQKRFTDAEAIFKKMDEKLYEVYLSRIAEYQKNPPPEDWDGSYSF